MAAGGDGERSAARASCSLARLAFLGIGLLCVAGLLALGTWQVQRRAWKHALIERVEARIHAEPVAPPGPETWARFRPDDHAYRHVRVTGRFLHGSTILVQALTAYGGGYWVMTPLHTQDGFDILVNRGFVPSDRRDPASWTQPEGEITLTGLLRATEPGGAFLRRNDAVHGRWYGRDVAAIARAGGLAEVAPYFIDAEATQGGDRLPIPGLTVVRFADNHLVYALTWYALAAMLLAALVYVARSGSARSRPWDAH